MSILTVAFEPIEITRGASLNYTAVLQDEDGALWADALPPDESMEADWTATMSVKRRASDQTALATWTSEAGHLVFNDVFSTLSIEPGVVEVPVGSHVYGVTIITKDGTVFKNDPAPFIVKQGAD